MSTSQHPQPEILGAFTEGRLEGRERAEVVEHLATCDLCIGFVRGAREAAGDAAVVSLVTRTSSFSRPRFLAAAAVIIAALATIVGRDAFLGSSRAQGVKALIDASPASYRTIEPRLTGFRWAELRHLRAGEGSRPDPEALKLAGAAGEVLTAVRGRDTASAHHAAGVASLVVRDSDRAIEELKNATARDPKDAAAWNDLAAALYTSAVQQRRAADLPQALAAAERAAQVGASLPEARFNRALILERMGLQSEAAAAWREYLAIEPGSRWSEEAKKHLDALAAKPQARFRDRIAMMETAAAAGDRTRIDAELRDFPQEVRGWFEADVLGRWGEAELRGEVTTAAALLAGARTVGAALQAKSGESLLADAVAAIATAQGDRRRTLARAHMAYRAGRLAYRDHKPAEAERGLLAAASALDAGGSPMSGVARTYAASVIFDQNRMAEAAALVEPIVAGPNDRQVALHAQAALLLGRCDAYACRWSDALRHFSAAERGYRRTGEPSNIAEAENALGEVYANAGEVGKAWQHRLAALQIFGSGAYGTRLLAALATAARGELRNERWESAEALLRLEIAEARRIDDPLLIADAHKRRAMLYAQRGETDAASGDLREARGYASRAADSGLRERFAAECSLVEGVTLRTRHSARSVAVLTAAIEFARRSGDRRLLPEALLERARTFRAAGRLGDAWSDLAVGIDDVEDRRTTAAGGPGATFDAATSLFDEAIDLLLARGENERAFEYVERARARALLDAIEARGSDDRPAVGTTVAATAAALPPGVALVEYALLPDRVVVFRVTRDGLRVAQRPVNRASVEADVRSLRLQIEERVPVDAIRAMSARLDESLLAPLRALGGDPSSLVIVGDRVLQSVPWAALWDNARQEYLVERCAVSVAPSAGVWLRNRARLSADRKGDRLLLITSDMRPDLDPLEDLRRERIGLEAAYARHASLTDDEATPERFLEHASSVDVVHYAGHARQASDTREAALLLSGESELSASQIARSHLARPWLVVLAACGTMAGRTSGLEGSPDLARAFLAAGVPTVVGTLWPVQDAHAATLFVTFHKGIRAGSAAPTALRDAQLAMLRGPASEAAHPAAWAAAEVMGGAL